MRHKLIAAAAHVHLSEEDSAAIDEIVEWRREAFFPRVGRSAWMKLRTPISVPCFDTQIQVRSVKIKGAGLFNHRGERLKPHAQPYVGEGWHLGFSADGQFKHVASSPAPMGGMTLDRGVTEFFVSGMLNMQRCPSQVPIRLYQYDEDGMTFRTGQSASNPFCVTVTGLPDEYWYRAIAIDDWIRAGSDFQDASIGEELIHVLERWAASMDIPKGSYRPLATLAGVLKRYGQTLRKFHEAGYYRHNGSTVNFIYSADMKSAVLTDLDSVRPLAECSAATKPLQHMRDVASPMARILYRLLNDTYIAKATPERVFGEDLYNPFKNVLLGYYHDVPIDVIERVDEKVRADYEHRYSVAMERHEEGAGEVDYSKMTYEERSKRRRDYYWVDFDELFPFYTTALWELHALSGLGRQHPHRVRKADVCDSIAALTSREFASRITRSA